MIRLVTVTYASFYVLFLKHVQK